MPGNRASPPASFRRRFRRISSFTETRPFHPERLSSPRVLGWDMHAPPLSLYICGGGEASAAGLLRVGLQHVQEALEGGELPGGGGVQLGREERGGGVAGQEGEELVVHGGEGGLLEEQLVDRD